MAFLLQKADGRDMFTALVELTTALKAESAVAKELRTYIGDEKKRIQTLEQLSMLWKIRAA